MLRDKNLIPLSRQHQHALALCVRLDRAMQAGEIDLAAWQAEIADIFEQEIAVHFTAEEKEIFPRAEKFPELTPVVQALISEHATLRGLFSRAESSALSQAELASFCMQLARHIRREERELFEGMQRVMSADDLAATGAGLEKELAAAAKSCRLPGK